ncbi:MAG: SH3 domain-containing protein, partial [Clostridia bacterium]|nr:SH3 domain-containing protein [Clostridia bacterium]
MNTKKNNTTLRAIFSVIAAFIVLSCALFNDYGRGTPVAPDAHADGLGTSASDTPQSNATETTTTTTAVTQTTDPTQDEEMMESFQGILDLPPESYDIQPQTLTEMGQLTVNADIVNVRTDANGSAPLLATIRAGEKYTVYGQKTSPTGILWLLIKTGDKVGYVSSS